MTGGGTGSSQAPPRTEREHGATTDVSIPRDRPVPGFEPKHNNRYVEALMRRIGWPKKRGKDGKVKIRARGVLFTPDGYSWTGRPLRSKRNGPARARTDLKEPWASDDDIRTTRHIEGNAAALMVAHKQKTAVLYLNMPPCGGADKPDPKRCHDNIPKILPKDYTMIVHSILENGGYRRIVYRGTGEALK